MANEKRLIDPEKCYCIAKAYHSDFEQNLANLHSLRELLDDCPTADAVEVVRCKDCKHSDVFDTLLYCEHTRGLAGSVLPDGFCYLGERRNND